MRQLLPFNVSYETYALELVDVQEVVENRKIYGFPGSPKVIAGAISFHGRIVPVVDLAQLLDFPAGKPGQRLIVLINERGPVALGVDQVLAIVNIEANQASQKENHVDQNYIKDIINCEGGMISLFDLDQLQVELEALCLQTGG